MKPEEITDELIERIIERCYMYDQTLIVNDLGRSWARLNQGNYTYCAHGREYQKKKTMRALKSIFMQLIDRHLRFTYNDQRFYYANGTWKEAKDLSK